MVFIIVCHEGPRLATSRLATSRLAQTPSALLGWLIEDKSTAAFAKDGHFLRAFNLPVRPWFMSLERLAKNLHGFFQCRIRQARRSGLVLPRADPNGDFREYVDHLARAVKGLESPGEDRLSGVDLEPADVFIDDFNWGEQPHHGISKRCLDDPYAPKFQRVKRVRFGEGVAVEGPVIEIVDWATASSEPDCMIGTSVVIPMYRK